MRISDWSSDVCSSDLAVDRRRPVVAVVDRGDAGLRLRRDRGDPGHLLFDRRDVFGLELGRARPAAAAAETLPGPDLKDVGAETRDLLLHRAGGRVSPRHPRADRADPAHDPDAVPEHTPPK